MCRCPSTRSICTTRWMEEQISASASAGSSEDAPRISRVRNRSNAPCALLAWMVANAPRCPVFIESSSVRASVHGFLQDDAVGTMAERGFEQVVEGDRVPVRIGLGFLLDHVRFADVQLGGVFDNQDALLFRIWRRRAR